MVSKLEILSRYYQMTIQSINEGYFEYNENTYFLTEDRIHPYIQNNYAKHVQDYQLEGFYMVKNCYGSYQSEQYILFVYHAYPISLELMLDIGSRFVLKEEIYVEHIKKRWCNRVDRARQEISKHASSIQLNELYVVLSYYYIGLGEHAIHLLNRISSKKIPTSIQHYNAIPYYHYLLAPTNLLLSSRVRDVLYCYKRGYLDIKGVERCITKYQYSYDELVYMYARMIYPSDFFDVSIQKDLEIEMASMYQQLQLEQERIKDMYQLLSTYIDLPFLQWL